MLEDACDEALPLARVSLLPCGREVEQLGFAPLDVDGACVGRVLKPTLLLVQLVTSLAERLPVVLPVLEESPGAIKLGIQTLDCGSRASTGCSRPAGSSKAIPQCNMHLAAWHEL